MLATSDAICPPPAGMQLAGMRSGRTEAPDQAAGAAPQVWQ